MHTTDASPAKPKKRPREKLSATIQVLHDNPDKTSPLVGHFPSGYDPSSRLRGSAEPSIRVYRHSDEPNRLQLVIRPPESDVAFVGSSSSDEPTLRQSCTNALGVLDRVSRHGKKPNRLQLVVRPPEDNDEDGSNFNREPTLTDYCTYRIGVLDKESQTLKIVPIACNEIFRLEPRVGSDFANEEHSDLVRGELSAKEKADKVRELNLLFGTKRSVKQDKKMQSLRQEDDPNSQKDLDRKIKEVTINKEALESTGSHTAHNIPPYNSSATVPKDVYPIEKIILKGEWDYIRDILQLLEAGEKVSPDAYPKFVRNRIHKLGETEDEMEKETLGCIFSYINHLIKFKDQHSADGASSAKNHKTPSILRQKFLTMFSNSESKWLPSGKIDLLISYVLVLTLVADDFRTDPTDIAKDLRMSSVTIRQHFEHLGCKFSREKNALYAKLPVPLKFPELRKRRRR